MVTWKEVHVQEEMRRVRMAEAEQARMVKFVKSGNERKTPSMNRPYLLVLGAVTWLVKATGSLKVQSPELPLASES